MPGCVWRDPPTRGPFGAHCTPATRLNHGDAVGMTVAKRALKCEAVVQPSQEIAPVVTPPGWSRKIGAPRKLLCCISCARAVAPTLATRRPAAASLTNAFMVLRLRERGGEWNCRTADN